jgi:WD40 repeat protein
MHRSTLSSWKMVLIVAVVLALAALACGVPGGEQTAPPTPTTAAEPTDEAAPATDEVVPTVAPEPTDAPVETQEPKPTEDEVTDTPPVTGNGITLDNASDLTELWSVQVSQSSLLASAVSPLSHEVATFGIDKIVRLWDGDTGELISELRPAHAAEGWGLAYSPDGSMLASGGGFEARIWDATTGQMFSSATVNAYVFKTVWSPDNTLLAVVGYGSSKIQVINPETGSNEFDIASPDSIILWSAAISQVNGILMATGNENGGIRVLDLSADPAEELVYDKDPSRGSIIDLEFSPDGSMLAACTGAGGIYMLDTSSWGVLWSSPGMHARGCNDGVFTPDGDVYFTVGTDGFIHAWDAVEGRKLTSLRTDGSSTIWSIGVSGDGEILALALANGVVSVLGLP